MKIRTDFVTNSSSSSFVAYRLEDSEFCRFISRFLKERGLKYAEYDEHRPASFIELNDDFLSAEINCGNDFSLLCNNYLEGCAGNCYFEMSIEDIEDYLTEDAAKEEFRRILSEELKETDFEELLDEDEMDYYSGDCRYAIEICDEDDFHLCSRLYSLLKDCKTDNHIKKIDDMIRIMTDPYEEDENKNEEIFIDLFTDRLYVTTFDGYHTYEKEMDIDDMSETDSFMEVMSWFIPIDDDIRDEAEKLFEKDKENGKFTCDVHVGNTD